MMMMTMSEKRVLIRLELFELPTSHSPLSLSVLFPTKDPLLNELDFTQTQFYKYTYITLMIVSRAETIDVHSRAY